MKTLLFWLILLICLFRLLPAQAEDWSVRFGPSIQNDATNGSSKTFGVRREELLMSGIHSGMELGGYVDNGGNGRKGSGLAKLQLGVKPGESVGIYGFGFFGPCGITRTDTQLSTNLEFSTDIGIGIRDRETFMNIGYNHISNAGISLPNHGRDALLFSIGISL